MKIKCIETFCDPFVGFVRVTAEDGAQGWGQVSTYNADISALVLHRQVAPWSLGRDADDIGALLDTIQRARAQISRLLHVPRHGRPRTALWDLRGKRRGKERVRTARWPAAAQSRLRIVDEARHHAGGRGRALRRLRDQFGFDAFKFRVGAECGHDVDEWPGRTEQIVPAMRKALGDKVALLADANSGFSPKRAIEVGRMLEDNGISHFEEPCPYWELEQTKEVATPSTSTSQAASRTAGSRSGDA